MLIACPLLTSKISNNNNSVDNNNDNKMLQ